MELGAEPQEEEQPEPENMTDEERIKLLEKATGPEDIRAAIAGLTPEELAEMGIV